MGSILHVAKPRAETGDRGQGARRLACERTRQRLPKEDETDSFWKTPIHLRLAGLPWPNVTRPSFERLPATRPKASTERLNPLQGRNGGKSKLRITQSAATLIASPSTDWPRTTGHGGLWTTISAMGFSCDDNKMHMANSKAPRRLKSNAQDARIAWISLE